MGQGVGAGRVFVSFMAENIQAHIACPGFPVQISSQSIAAATPIPPRQRSTLKRFIQPFVQLEIQLHILVGNHDIYFRNTNDLNSLNESYSLIHSPLQKASLHGATWLHKSS